MTHVQGLDLWHITVTYFACIRLISWHQWHYSFLIFLSLAFFSLALVLPFSSVYLLNVDVWGCFVLSPLLSHFLIPFGWPLPFSGYQPYLSDDGIISLSVHGLSTRYPLIELQVLQIHQISYWSSLSSQICSLCVLCFSEYCYCYFLEISHSYFIDTSPTPMYWLHND